MNIAKQCTDFSYVVIKGKQCRPGTIIHVENTKKGFHKVLALDVSPDGRERPVMIQESTRLHDDRGYILTNWPHISKIKVYTS